MNNEVKSHPARKGHTLRRVATRYLKIRHDKKNIVIQFSWAKVP